LGFFSLALIIRFGQRIQTFAGVIGWIFAPMCGVFYTMDVLPSWMQMIGFLLPMSYIFKSIHAYMLHGIMPISTLLSSFWINAVYLFASLFFLKCMFARALQRGLARLEND
jgi:ABC-2 type transport system permease protein